MSNFSVEKAKDMPGDWKSPGMYTHRHGYKFCIGVDANGVERARVRGISVHLYVMVGEYDEDLKWPVEATFTVGVIRQARQRNVEHSKKIRWTRPKTQYKKLMSFGMVSCSPGLLLINHSELSDYLINRIEHF